MAFKLSNVSNNIITNITPIVDSISWSSNVNEISEELDFSIIYSDTLYSPKKPINFDNSNMVIFQNDNDEIFRGFIISELVDSRKPIQYVCYDAGFYLNKNNVLYQFNTNASNALTKIFNDISIPIGNIAKLKTIIKKNYINKTPIDVIKDILDFEKKSTGIKYKLEIRLGKVYIEKQEDLIIKAQFKLFDSDSLKDSQLIISNPSRKRSIENMKNSIQIISGDEQIAKVYANQKNEVLIKKYGLLQYIEKIENKDLAQANNIAKNLLSDLGKIFEENSIEWIGDYKAKAGRLIEIEETITGMKGKYLIKSANHTLKNGIHKMKLDLELI